MTAKTASDYPVTFAFKEQDGYYYGPNGIVGLYHHGEDRAMSIGVPVVVAGATIGKSGNTGQSGGPHVHIDKRKAGTLTSFRANFVNPKGWVNIKKATVTFAGNAGSAGNMIALKDGIYEYRFLHLDKINVKVGQVIKEKNMATILTRALVKKEYLANRGTAPNEKDYKAWTGKPFESLSFAFAKENANVRTAQKQLRNALIKTREQVKELSARPTKAELQKLNDTLKKAEDKLNAYNTDDKLTITRSAWGGLFDLVKSFLRKG